MTTKCAAATNIALWLADNTDTIARNETAGDLYRDIKDKIHQIEHVINRPIPDRFCGTCATSIDGTLCGLALYAPREAIEVHCARCKTTHNVEKLFQRTLDNSDDKSFTISELHRTILPAVREYVPPRTLQHWAAHGRLVPTGYGADGEPRFLLADVRRLRAMKTQSAATGAAAHKASA
jgi:hypothetical protein